MSNTKTCCNRAAFRYTWPGRDESFICAHHAPALSSVADAMGLHLQLIPLDDKEERDQRSCAQRVSP